MSNANSTNFVDGIKLPLQKAGKGNAIVDPTALGQNTTQTDKTTEVTKTTKAISPKSTTTSTPTPEQIFNHASQSILYQDTALKALSTIFYYHLESIRQNQLDNELAYLLGVDGKDSSKSQKNYAQAPIFLTGKTGSGKTHIIKQLCKLHDVNFMPINSASLSNAGHKGFTLEDVGNLIMQSAKQDRAKAEYSVVFFDEFDKLFLDKTQSSNLGFYHRSLITEILTIIEGTTDFPVKDEAGLDSSKMLFILGGSFNMHQAEEKTVIGFTAEKPLKNVPNTQLKLTDFGLPDELAGRIGKIITMQDIDESKMIDILLKSPNSPYVAFCEKLAMVNCRVAIDDSVLQALLVKQSEAIRKFGVRGIFQGFSELPQLADILYDAPNYPKTYYTITSTGFVSNRDEIAIAKAILKERLEQERLREQPLEDDIPF